MAKTSIEEHLTCERRLERAKNRLGRQQMRNVLMMSSMDEELLYLARLMRNGGLPEETWFCLASRRIEMLSDERFEYAVETYLPGHGARWRRIVRAHRRKDCQEICNLPEMEALDDEWSKAKDHFTADLLRCYGFEDLAEIYLSDHGEFERREEASFAFHRSSRHHFATTGHCWTGSDCGEEPRCFDKGTVIIPDLLPELRVSAMAQA
jgi:hypothetical protein